MKTTGAGIRELRERLVLTQAEFAAKLDVANDTVSKWELKKQRPRAKHWRTMARLERKLEERK